MKKAVIFDLDGTLADSLTSIWFCTNKALENKGYPVIEKEAYKYLVGDGAKTLIKRALETVGEQDPEAIQPLLEEYLSIFQEHCMYEVKPYPQIEQLILQLKSQGVRIAVLSNKPHEQTLDVIHTLFGDHVFDMVLGQREGIEKKPSPTGVFSIMNELGVKPEDVIYLGDTDTDMQTGKAAEVFTIGALWGFREEKELQINGADELIKEPLDLIKFLL